MENIIIESNQNKIIKEVNSLKAKKERDKTGLFILEGKRLVDEIPNSWEIKYLLKAESYSEDINFENVYTVKDSLFEKISETVNPQGILAVCHIKEFDVTNVDYSNSPFFVVLENVTDPGNMGTLIRTADAAGADGIFLSKGCVDIYNPKVIRATMGSIFHLPIYRNLNLMDLMEDFKNNNVKTLAAHLKGTSTPYKVDMTTACAVIIGNEANGLSDEISEIASDLVKIPMPGKAESMNAGIAGGILIYEAVRQRIEE
jgi:TrmH family RNA methyltransferase